MGLYRDENGLVFEVDDVFARTQGYEPVTPSDEHAMLQQQAYKDRAEEDGALGTARAAATGLASSLTLGGTDWLLGQGLSEGERQALAAELEAHPIARAGGEITGALMGGLAAPGSALAKTTPAGYLGSIASREVAEGVAQGGVRGTAKALGAMGTEGAAQSVGSYLGWTSLQDKDVTAEGLAGALGTGYAFGSAGGGVALGVSKGTVAARRMFSRLMDGGDDAVKTAESAWTKTQQEMLETDAMNADIARRRLDDITAAKMEAIRYRNQAKAGVQEEKLRAMAQKSGPAGETQVSQTSSAQAFEGPEPLIEFGPSQGGMPTSVFKAPEAIEFNPAAANDFDNSLPLMEGGELVPTELMAPAQGGPVTSVFKAPTTEVIPASKAAPAAGTELEAQLAGTKAQLDKGTPLKAVGEKAVPGSAVSPQIPPSKKPPLQPGKNPSGEIEKMLREKGVRDGSIMPDYVQGVPKLDQAAHVDALKHQALLEEGQLRRNNPPVPEYGPKNKQRFGNLRTHLGQELDVGPLSGKKPTEFQGPLSDLRFKKTEELLGKAVAEEEAKLLTALGEREAAIGDLANDFVLPPRAADDVAGLRREWLRNEPTNSRFGVDLPVSTPTQMGPTNQLRSEMMAKLDRAHEDALQRVAEATDDVARGEAVRTATELENLLEHLNSPKIQTERGQLGGVVDWMDEIDRGAKSAERAEKAYAKLVDALGEDAHPLSQEYAKQINSAEGEAMKKTYDRTARAIEDAEQFGPEYKSPAERVQYARERKLDADRNLDAVKLDEMSAKRDNAAATKKLKQSEAMKKAALRTDARTANTGAAVGKATTIGGILEIADLPGMPKPSDIPVVGPLLGAWLKYKTIKAALGRAGGRVAATPNARVAVLAARTRDRIAKAVDKSLATMASGSSKAARAIPQAAGVLANRIYDDGQPDAKKGAPLPELAGVRMRELQAYVSTPNAIERDVRRELRGVTDPDLIAAAEKHRRAAFEYIASTLPKLPEPGMLEKVKWQPHTLQALSFARRMEALSDPAGTLERLSATQGAISLEAAETLRTVYPQLFQHAQQRLLQHAAQMQENIPRPQRVKLSLVYQLPLDSSLDPDRLKLTQQVFEKSSTPAPVSPDQPAAPPTPSVAQPTDISASLMTPADRRALTR